jgi:hypothetical protein
MKTTLALAALLLGGSAALAQPAPSATTSHAVPLIKLPNGDYTVPMRELEGSNTTGKVTLHRQGMSTLVTVYVFGNGHHKYRFNLKSGSDCVHASAAGAVALKPAVPGQPSQTLVSVPIENFSSKNYVIDMQNATAENQFKEACARL